MSNLAILNILLQGASLVSDTFIKNNKIKLDAHNEGLRIKTNAANIALATLAPILAKVTVDIIKHNVDNGKIPKYYAIVKDKSGKIIEQIPLLKKDVDSTNLAIKTIENSKIKMIEKGK